MHNLVKTFLTSIKFTFDNLSRKIKNPCLVINKNFLKEDFTMKSKQIIIMLLSFIILFAISCKNDDKTGGGSGGGGSLNIPTASGNNATVGNAEFTGDIKCKYLNGNGWTEEAVNNMITPFTLEISGNKVYMGLTMKSGKQLLCPDSSNPNVVEADGKLEQDGTTWQEYIKITLDNANNPATATIIYWFGMYIPAYAENPSMSDTVVARYEGTLNKK